MAVRPRPLDEQGILLLGGTSGIGLAAARAFAAEGARVALVARSPERGQAAAQSIGAGARFFQADCADHEALESAVAAAAAWLGRIDTSLCSIGGAVLPELFHRQSYSDIAEALGRDLAPVLLSARAVLAHMRGAGGGTILNVASDAAKVATPGEAVIGANMAAIVQFTRALALEGRRDGVRANVLTPSLVEGTPLTERLMEEGRFSAKLFAKARPMAGLGPTYPDDLAALAVFLARPEAALITGQAISVNGGISAA